MLTERLVFREISEQDTDNIHRLHSLPATDEFNTLGIPASVGETRIVMDGWFARINSIPQTGYVFNLLDKSNPDQFMGLAGMNIGKINFKNAEIWYKIDPAHWGKGLATEAARGLLAFGFNVLKLHRIEAGCAVENTASRKVIEKTGMKLEGVKRKILPIRGNWVDAFSFAILEEDYHMNHG